MGYVLDANEGKKLVWALGGLVNSRAASDQTDGLFDLLEHTGRAGYASPIHTHLNESESFYVIEGQVTFVVGEEEVTAKAGSFAYVPPKEPHAFRVDSPTARFLMLVTPSRLLPFFEEIGEPALSPSLPPAPEDPPDEQALVEAATRHGMEILGPPPGMQ